MQIRPFIEMRVGQVNLPLRVPISPLLVDALTTTLAANTSVGVTLLNVTNGSQFLANFPILIGEPGNQNSEIVYLSGTGSNSLSLSSGTLYPHSASTTIYQLIFDTIELYHSDTVDGIKTVVNTINITPGITTDYNDTLNTGGYYFARFVQYISGGIDPSSVYVDTTGADYSIGDVLTLQAGNSDATVRVTSVGVGELNFAIIAAQGSGYTQGDQLIVSGGDGNAVLNVDAVDGGGVIQHLSIVVPGTGYSDGSGVALSGGTGDQAATADISVNAVGAVLEVVVVNSGTGFNSSGIASTTGGTGTGAVIGYSVAFFSPYSDDVPYEGYDLRSARFVIDSALNEINKSESQTLTDEFMFQQLDNCQNEVIQDLKRWSFMQLFDQTVGHTATGSWKFNLPNDIGVNNSNKSIYQLRVGTQQRLVWVDKKKFDEFLVGVAYSTLAAPAENGDTTLTLVDSSSFNSLASQTDDGSGSVTIGANTYDYSANDTVTGILTLNTAVTADTTAPLGADVFQGATQGLPNYWTTYGGVAYYWPIASQSYNGFQLLMDYYTRQLKITSDSDLLILPDTTVAINYLAWKALKKLSNGSETQDSAAYRDQYLSRKEKMRIKEVSNSTFKFKPRVQNFAVQSEFNESTPRWVRDAEFPNTGF